MKRTKKASARKPVAKKESKLNPNEWVDPFEIPANVIPKGKEYQWVPTYRSPGEEGHEIIDKQAEGWTVVPLSRHKKLFPKCKGKHIVVDDLKLFERKKHSGFTSANLEAIRMRDEHPAWQMELSKRTGKIEGSRFPIMPESWNESASYEHIPSDATSVQISVQIPFWLSGRYQDAASALGLTNEVYAQRQILLHLSGQIDGLLMPADGAFDLIQKSFHWKRDNG